MLLHVSTWAEKKAVAFVKGKKTPPRYDSGHD
jgi:hypothetical protein